jgi:hypothetical protein
MGREWEWGLEAAWAIGGVLGDASFASRSRTRTIDRSSGSTVGILFQDYQTILESISVIDEERKVASSHYITNIIDPRLDSTRPGSHDDTSFKETRSVAFHPLLSSRRQLSCCSFSVSVSIFSVLSILLFFFGMALRSPFSGPSVRWSVNQPRR